jgi:hypothetical protein
VQVFADRTLSRRLERAEGRACREFVMARTQLYPEAGAAWIESAGTYAMFDGVDSPITQTFGLGLFEEITPETLDVIEGFFNERSSPVVHEVSPLAGVPTLDLLCARGYRPIELSSLLYKPLVRTEVDIDKKDDVGIVVRAISPLDGPLWANISARGWAVGHPEMLASIEQFGRLATACEHSVCFLGELDGQPGAAGVLSIHEGVALFGGASTIPGMRKRGLQLALLEARMQYAVGQGCDLAMMVTEVGSQSQRNAERTGFRIAYTRTKWRLASRS